MSNKTQNDQTPFIHIFTRKTRTPEHWKDQFRVCWYFNPDTLDYIYEHKDHRFSTNGFVLSKGLFVQLPVELQSKFFEANERGLIFSVFGSIMQKYLTENIKDEEMLSIFGVSKKRYFSKDAYDEFEEMIDLI